MELTSLLINALVAILAAFIGGFMALLTAYVTLQNTFAHNKKQQDQVRNELIRGFLLGVKTEIQGLLHIYQEEIGAEKLKILERGKPFLFYYPIGQNYFTSAFPLHSEHLNN